MNARERGLVEYYDRTLNYYSPVSAEALKWFDIDWIAVDNVLDLGCGDGRLFNWVPPLGAVYLGIDGSAGRIADARRRWPGVEFQVSDLYDPLPAGPWSLICLFEVLEHLADPLAVLSAARRALFPGGRLIGSVPINSPGERHLQVFKTTKEVAERLSPTAMHAYGRHVLLEWNNELKADSCQPSANEPPLHASRLTNDASMARGPGHGPTAVANAHRAPVSPPNDAEAD